MVTDYVPDPEDEANVEAVLADPEVQASLDEMDDQESRGELVTYTHEEVLSRLSALGVRKPEVPGHDQV